MEINIDRDSGIPIYIQIKEQIRDMVKREILTKGDRLPPERELAQKLHVSRNRVSTAYKELEDEKILYSRQGKGTFVAGKVTGVHKASRKDKLLRIIDLAMEESLELGFTLDDFLTIAYVRAREKKELLRKTRIVFIECNQEQLTTLVRETEVNQDVVKISVLTEEMESEPARIKKLLRRAEIIITTPFHIETVEQFVAGMEKDIINMSLEPKMETIVELARIKPGAGVGLVCQSTNFIREVERSLAEIGLNEFEFTYFVDENDELKSFVKNKDIIVTSPHRYSEVLELISGEKRVIKFEYAPDRGSLNMLKNALLDLKVV